MGALMSSLVISVLLSLDYILPYLDAIPACDVPRWCVTPPPESIIMSIDMGDPKMKLKLRAVGTSTGVLLPKEMLVRLKLKRNDTLFAVETPEGYLLTPYDPEVERQLSKGRELMRKYRDTFRALAK